MTEETPKVPRAQALLRLQGARERLIDADRRNVHCDDLFTRRRLAWERWHEAVKTFREAV